MAWNLSSSRLRLIGSRRHHRDRAGQPHQVAAAGARVGTHVLDPRVESGAAQPAREAVRVERRPHGEVTIDPQGLAGAQEAGHAVQRRVRGCRERLGTVVDVHEDGVVPRLGAGDGAVDVADGDADAAIGQRIAGEMGEGPLVPANDLGHELEHLDRRVGGKCVEGRAHGEAHAQPADEDPGATLAGEMRASERAERVLRRVDAAVHEIGPVDADGELVTASGQDQLVTGGRLHLLDDFPGNHGCGQHRGSEGSGSLRA